MLLVFLIKKRVHNYKKSIKNIKVIKYRELYNYVLILLKLSFFSDCFILIFCYILNNSINRSCHSI